MPVIHVPIPDRGRREERIAVPNVPFGWNRKAPDCYARPGRIASQFAKRPAPAIFDVGIVAAGTTRVVVTRLD